MDDFYMINGKFARDNRYVTVIFSHGALFSSTVIPYSPYHQAIIISPLCSIFWNLRIFVKKLHRN